MCKQQFLHDLNLLVVKNHVPIQFVESTCLEHIAMHLCSKVVFFLESSFHKKCCPIS